MFNNFLGDFDSRGPQPEPQQFIIKSVTPRSRENPSMDYRKLLAMLAGALIAGLAFDAVMRAGEERIEL